MTLTVDLVLLIIAAICFVAAAFGVSAGGRVDTLKLVAVGLFCWVLTAIV